MIENFSPKSKDRLPMEVRNPFQRFVFEKLGINQDPDRVFTDGKIISEYIDNPNNTEVRDLIIENKYEEAFVIIKSEIRRVEELSQAA